MWILSWLVVLMGESVRFTPWGLLSGLLWVLGGTGGIYGIRKAGMSVAVGTWSSTMVIINFLFGIVLFQEPVASVPRTFAAFVLLGLGLVGMSVYSAPKASSTAPPPDLMETEMMQNQEPDLDQDFTPILAVRSDGSLYKDHPMARLSPSQSRSHEALHSMSAAGYDTIPRDPTAADLHDNSRGSNRKGSNNILGLDNRQLGITGAVINGIFTGSSLVPIYYAKNQDFGGTAYMLSFATGALLSNLMVWLVWFIGLLLVVPKDKTNSGLQSIVMHTYESMPPFTSASYGSQASRQGSCWQ